MSLRKYAGELARSGIFRRLSIRVYHFQTFARLGQSATDRCRLARLGWGVVDAGKSVGISALNDWSVRLKMLSGKKVHLCPHDTCHLGIFTEVMIHAAYDFALIPFEPDLIIDVGAHIGLFSLRAATRWPRTPIVAFEPHPENALWARRNFSSNDLRATLFEVAVSSQAGWMEFELGGGMGRLRAGGSTKVMGVDLSTMLRAFPCSKMLLKMDIEGGEMEVLPNILSCLPSATAVFVELHGSVGECESMERIIAFRGFDIKVKHEKFSQDGGTKYVDLLLTPTAAPFLN